ncbi:hypothetical protein IWW34DRAFT_892913 [Fusarium oxysporum f. sp. albedinis]|nr:hypothetical protein IWW34DRAFT_892913 [Fusarium oxysporum f. sp. albedinis]
MKSLLSLALVSLTAIASGVDAIAPKCRCLPGDTCWPSDTGNVWSRFKKTVNGLLIKTVPIGSPCHDPNYDEEACTALQQAWRLPQTHIDSSSSVMQPYFANQSCLQSRPCTLGNYVNYAVKVSNARHVAAAVRFANDHNIRLVIRNTGHDTEVVHWADKLYNGPALKLGAGIQGADAVEFANDNGLTGISGDTSYGLGADQALEFEVVTAAGRIVRASSRENSDLYSLLRNINNIYWALSGGGAGKFAIVTSITVRAHYIDTIGGATLALPAGTDKEAFYAAVSKFHELLPAMIDHGPTVVYYVTGAVLQIKPITLVNSTGEYVRDKILAPFTAYLAEAGLRHAVSYTTLRYRDHYDTYMGPLPDGHIKAAAFQFGGRLIPRDVVENDTDSFNKVIRDLTSKGVICVGSSGTFKAYPGASNAVHPAWRKAIMSMQIGTLWDRTRWDDMLADQKHITNEFMPQLEAITPGSGTYMNEADFNQPNWKEVFYSTNWDRLLAAKKKWDPKSLFYNHMGVGSDVWTVVEDGCMCKA